MFIRLNAVQTDDNTTIDMNSSLHNNPKLLEDHTPTSSMNNSIVINNESLPPVVSSEDIQNCLDDGDAENTNNTITSSDMDMEFEVDEQILESFVDDNNSLMLQ
jgi:hypothetical protein